MSRNGARTLRDDLLFFACVLLAQAVVVLPLDRVIGLYEDDGVYAVTAGSLANGDRYRLPHLPGEPWQTKYPPAWPWLLSVPWRLLPSATTSSWALILPGIACAAGAAALARRYLRVGLGLSNATATMLSLAAALSVDVMGFLSLPLSEPLFALFVGATLVLALPLREEGRAMPVRVAVIAALCAAAALTRQIGLVVPLAIALALWRWRRRTEALWVAALVALSMLPWWLWQKAARAANAALEANPFAAYDLDYTTWVLSDPASLALVVWRNLVQLQSSFAILLQGGTGGPFEGMVGGGGVSRSLAHALALASLGLIVLGYARSAKRSEGPLQFLVPMYVGVVLVWPFESYRFYLPLLPYLLAFAVEGAAAVGGHRRGAWRDLARPVLASAILALTVAKLVLWVASAHANPSLFLGGRDNLPKIRRMFKVVARAVPERSVVAVGRPAMVHLYTGRKAVELWPYDDPLIGYAEKANYATFYARFPGDLRAATRERAREAFAALRRFGATHAVVWDSAKSDREVLFTDWAIRLRLPIVHDDKELGLKVIEIAGAELEQLLKEKR